MEFMEYFKNNLRKTDDITTDVMRLVNKADEEGRIVVLPCKPGDVVYPANASPRYEAKIESVTLDANGLSFTWVQHTQGGDDPEELWDDGEFTEADIGITVFRTREEAEARRKTNNQVVMGGEER